MALHRQVRGAALAGLLVLVLAEGAVAHVPQVDTAKAAKANAVCAEAIRAKQLSGANCFDLAAQMVDSLTRLFYRLTPRDVQGEVTSAATAGSLAQSEPVPGIQPLGVAGASIAAVGADSGAKAIVAVTVNPAIFFTSPGNTGEIARASRIADLTLLFPVDDLDRNEDGKVDYFGARLRPNFTGSKAGRALLAKAGEALLKTVQEETNLTHRLDTLLGQAPLIGDCYDALLATRQDKARIAEQCGSQLTMELDQQQYADVSQRLVPMALNMITYCLDFRSRPRHIASNGRGPMSRESPYRIRLSRDERRILETRSRQYTLPYREVVRARIVLLAAQGLENSVIGARLDLPRPVVSKWRKRFFEERLAGLDERPRPGRPAGFFPSRGRAGEGTCL